MNNKKVTLSSLCVISVILIGLSIGAVFYDATTGTLYGSLIGSVIGGLISYLIFKQEL